MTRPSDRIRAQHMLDAARDVAGPAAESSRDDLGVDLSFRYGRTRGEAEAAMRGGPR